MTQRFRFTQVALLALFAAGAGGEAFAAAQRTFVASYGVDNPACSLTSPCRAFAAAMAATLSGGEIIVLDSAGYGGVAIAQPVSIIAPPGVYAGITVQSGTGITITAGTGKVTLRGLSINALGGTTAIQVNSADTVYLDGVSVSGFSNGLVVSAAAATTVNLLRCAFRDNGNAATFASTGATTVSATIEGSVFERNTLAASFGSRTAGAIVGSLFAGGGSGVSLVPSAGTSKVEIRESNINDNSGNGVAASGTGATASVVSSVVSGNLVGLLASGAGNEVYASDTTITRNGTGVSAQSSGTTRTSGDNRLVNNTSNGAFTASTPKS